MRLSVGEKRRQKLSSKRSCTNTNSGFFLYSVHFLVLFQVMVGSMTCAAFSLCRSMRITRVHYHSLRQTRLLATSSDSTDSPRTICILGGGLAGLSAAFHLLEKKINVEITILDKAPVGKAGASSVAGGYVLNILST